MGVVIAIFAVRSVAHEKSKEETGDNYSTEGMCIGMNFGVCLGTMCDSIGLGISLGMLVGLTIGFCIRKTPKGAESKPE